MGEGSASPLKRFEIGLVLGFRSMDFRFVEILFEGFYLFFSQWKQFLFSFLKIDRYHQ